MYCLRMTSTALRNQTISPRVSRPTIVDSVFWCDQVRTGAPEVTLYLSTGQALVMRWDSNINAVCSTLYPANSDSGVEMAADRAVVIVPEVAALRDELVQRAEQWRAE